MLPSHGLWYGIGGLTDCFTIGDANHYGQPEIIMPGVYLSGSNPMARWRLHSAVRARFARQRSCFHQNHRLPRRLMMQVTAYGVQERSFFLRTIQDRMRHWRHST